MTHIQTVKVTPKRNSPYAKYVHVPAGVARLWKGDHITVELDFKNKKATIDKIEFYNNKVIKVGKSKKRKNSKDTNSKLGEWTAIHGNSEDLKEVFVCAVDSSKQVVLIVDTEDNEDDVRYWFSASGKTGRSNPTRWSIDPDVINKGGG